MVDAEKDQTSLPGIEHPRKGYVALDHIVRLFRNPWTGETITERSVQEWAEKNYFPRSEHRGYYNLVNVIGGVYWAQRALINRKKGPEAEEIDTLQLRELQAKTEKAEIEVQKLRGELVSAEEVKRAAYEKARQLRNMLESIPSRISAICAAEADAGKIKEIILREIALALQEQSQ